MSYKSYGCIATLVAVILFASSSIAATQPPPGAPTSDPVDGPPGLEPPPRSAPAPASIPIPADPVCAIHAVVHNRTKKSLKFIYSWPDTKAIIIKVEAKKDAEVAPVYCSSKLTITTAGQPFSINIIPNQNYELTWDQTIKQFVFVPTKKEEPTPKKHPSTASPPL